MFLRRHYPSLWIGEACLEPFQTSMMKHFAKSTILDVWQSPEYASGSLRTYSNHSNCKNIVSIVALWPWQYPHRVIRSYQSFDHFNFNMYASKFSEQIQWYFLLKKERLIESSIFFSFTKFHFICSNVTQVGNVWDRGAVVDLSVGIIKDINQGQCWQMFIQFSCPVTMNSTWYQGKVINDPCKQINVEYVS